MKRSLPLALLLVQLTTGAGLLSAQSAPLEGFDAYVREALAAWEVPGLAVAVVKDGETVFARGYGVRKLGESAEVDAGTLFAVGSTTKAMTAAAVGMLVDEGKLAWDDPVVRHLPAFRVADPYVTREMTVRDLLAHRTGVANSDFLWYEQESTPADILAAMRFVEQGASLRSAFLYQNVMYAAAGEVVAAVSGVPWSDFVRERIFSPLGMNGTLTTAATLAGEANVASPHSRVDDEIEVIENASVDRVAPAGSVWSNAGDMAKWVRFLLAGCVTESGERLLAEATCGELFTPQAVIRKDAFYPTARLTRPHWTTYGLGWFQADYRGRAADFHTGSIDGMVAIVGLVRDEGLGICVLANLDHAEVRHALMYRVFDLFGAGAERDWSRELLELYGSLRKAAEEEEEKNETRRVGGAMPSLPLERYAGRYRHPAYGAIEVTHESGLRLRFGKLSGDLEPWHYDTFRLTFDTAWRGSMFLSFVLDRSGDPTVLDAGFAEFQRAGPGSNRSDGSDGSD